MITQGQHLLVDFHYRYSLVNQNSIRKKNELDKYRPKQSLFIKKFFMLGHLHICMPFVHKNTELL